MAEEDEHRVEFERLLRAATRYADGCTARPVIPGACRISCV